MKMNKSSRIIVIILGILLVANIVLSIVAISKHPSPNKSENTPSLNRNDKAINACIARRGVPILQGSGRSMTECQGI